MKSLNLDRSLCVEFRLQVVTGIPLEFQFGTNWAAFSNYAGGIIGQTLAIDVFAFSGILVPGCAVVRWNRAVAGSCGRPV
ncbi:MAG: cytochrome ubiquinol oxidase subunit I [Nitrospira sp.]|nr:cytochrome ubiquinol oxidase subunit I [Nitrospira sp.]